MSTPGTPAPGEDHKDTPRCTAKAKGTGERCKRRPAPGSNVCVKHGAGAPQVRAAAGERLEQARQERALAEGLAAAYGEHVPPVDPAEAMLAAVSWKYAEVVALRVKVAELEDGERVWGVTREKSGGEDRGTTEEAKPHAWWVMLRTAEEQLVKFAAAARAAKVDERRVQVAEDQGRQIAGVLQVFAASMLESMLEQARDVEAFREAWGGAVALCAPAALRSIGGQS